MSAVQNRGTCRRSGHADVGPGYFWHSGVMAIGGDPVAAAKGDRALGWHYN